ncbi:MAG: hypothetical protein FGM33_05145 [Candidatus Kapabacteria bacterium]|nr:hypothetical protein [Candidatus Kapabacteria bacterium]
MNIILAIAVMCISVLTLPRAAAQQRVVATLSTRTMPVALARWGARPAVADALLRNKVVDALQSSSQQALLERLSLHVVVDLPLGATIDDIAAVDGVVDVRPLSRIRLHEGPLTNDSLSERQFALHRIGAQRAWKRATGKGAIVGIIDTGIDWTHEDLVDALDIRVKEDRNGNRRFDAWPSSDTIGGVAGDLNGVDDDGNGIVDDVIGIDLVDQTFRNLGDDRTYDPVPFDEQGHGTLVGGVIAATPDNRKGIAGLAYDARLRIVRAFDATGNAEEDDIASAIVYLALEGVDVINMSFGDGVDSPLMRDAIRFATERGCILVASVGNTGTTSRQFPAGYDEVIAVASTDDENRRSPFSSTGALVALCAPGQGIITTSVGSRYRTVNGTSFSAPYVAATIAMMRERFPTMSPADVRATLQQRSLDLGTRGWDELFGSGLVQADAALEDGPLSRVEITSPRNEIEIDPAKTPEIEVRGSSMLASFDGSDIAWGEGLRPEAWTSLTSSTTAVRDGLLARVRLPKSDSQVVTLRMRVRSSDGRFVDVFRRLRLVDSADFRQLSIDWERAWVTDRRNIVMTIRAARPCQCEVLDELRPLGPALAQSSRRSRVHFIVLPDTIALPSGQAGGRRFLVRCRPEVGAAVDSTIRLRIPTLAAGADAQWRSAGTAPWSGYVLNDVRDIYRDGRPTVVMNDLSRGTFGGVVTRQFVDGQWITRDSIPDVYIPRALGDANGNGRLELLLHSVGMVVLVEQNEVGGSPFGSVIYADTLSGLNAAGMADIDGDGREEILALADDSCLVLTYKESTFRTLGSIRNETPPEPGNARNRVDEISIATGDFDADGRMEVAFGDTDGDLVVGEWRDEKFVVSYSYTEPGAGGSGYVASADVDGDRVPDIIHGVPDNIEADANGDYGPSLWTYLVSSVSRSAGSLSLRWFQNIAGVRYGMGFRNGLGAADLDSLPGAEIIVCAFPRLYVFGASTGKEQEDIVCKRYIPDVASPRFLAYDFDGNGRNELGYGVTVAEIGAMTSFAFTEALSVENEAPRSLRSIWVGDSVRLDWVHFSEVILPGPITIIEQAEPSAPFQPIDTVMKGRFYTFDAAAMSAPVLRYRVRHLDTATGVISAPSNVVTVFRRDGNTYLALDRDSITLSEVRAGAHVRLTSSADLDMRGMMRSSFKLVDVGREHIGDASSAVARSLRDVLVSFPPSSITDTLRVSVSGLRDDQGRGLSDTLLLLRIVPDGARQPEITLASVRVESMRQLLLTFSEPVDASSTVAGNYRLAPAGRIISASSVDERTVRLQLAEDAPLEPRGVSYSVTATGVSAPTGARMTTGPGATLLFAVVASDLESVYAYPQPLRLGQHSTLTIAGLPSSASVEVLDAAFSSLTRLETTSGVGGIVWDLRLPDGRNLVPGLYYVRVADTANESTGPVLRKVWIER